MASLSYPIWLPTQISWVPCFSDIAPELNLAWECANLTVPIDYLATSGNATTVIGIAKAHPVELGTPLGPLFYQGHSGESNIFKYTSESLVDLLDMTSRKYDIILVDARGTGWSSPLTCGLTPDSYQNLVNRVSTDSAKAEAEIPFTENYLNRKVQTYMESAASVCGASEDPNYLAHVNAPNIARDLDLIRNLTGFDTMDYYGWHYGSVVGVTYAGLFPQRVGHMLLDRVFDFEKWMGRTGNALDYAYESRSHLPNVLHKFALGCVAAHKMDPKSCQLASCSIPTSDPADDIVKRINNIHNTLASKGPYPSVKFNFTHTLANIAAAIDFFLLTPGGWDSLATTLLDLEIAIHTQKPSSHIKQDIAFWNIDRENPFSGQWNSFVWPAVMYLDSSYANIADANSFVNYLSKQFRNNSLMAYQGLTAAHGLGWPNLAAHKVEKFTGPFPSHIRNKILIVAETYNPGYSVSSALSTYEFLGPNNAVMLIHDGLGHNFIMDPNDCTTHAIKAYFLNDILPINGTICHLDHCESMKYLVTNNRSTERILRGGLGFISLLILAGFWNVRRNKPTSILHRPKYIGRDDLKGSN